MKTLLRFFLFLACIVTGGEVSAKAPNDITIKIISKNNHEVTLTPNNADDDNLPVLPERLVESDGLAISATALEDAAVSWNITNPEGGATDLIQISKNEQDGKYYLVTKDVNEALKATITFTAAATASYETTSVSVTFLVDGRTVIDFALSYYAGSTNGVVTVDSPVFTIALFTSKDGGYPILMQGTDYDIAYTASPSDMISEMGGLLFFQKEGEATITATLTLKGDAANNYVCNRSVVQSAPFKVVAPVTITEAKYATFSSIYNRDFSNHGVQVYTIQAIEGNTAKLTEVTDGIVKAGEGVILYCDTIQTYTAPIVEATSSEDAYTGNLLKATNNSNETIYFHPDANTYNYILQNQEENGLGFYMATGKKLRANRSWLQLESEIPSGARLELVVDNETTAINEVQVETADQQAYYNLSGQRITTPRKGSLYIVNGKKYMK